MGRIADMTATAEALGALAAHLRARAEGIELDPAVSDALGRIGAAIGVDAAALDPLQLKVAATTARTYLRQAADFADNPSRSLGWRHAPPEVVQVQGRSSGAIARLIVGVIAPRLDGLEAALASPGAAFLDVGSGIGAIAVELCRALPNVRVVGLEPWDVPMAMARENVRAAGVEDRVELRPTTIEALEDEDAFDAVWLPGPFLSEGVVPAALVRAHAALHPGGWVLFGLFGGAEGDVADEVLRLRTIRTGGRPFESAEVESLLRATGFTEEHTVERTWNSPALIVAGRRQLQGAGRRGM